MSSAAHPGPLPKRSARKPLTIPLRQLARPLLRDPHQAFSEIVHRTGGAICRVSLGSLRPYLITRPEHVQHVLRDNAENYPREGMMWKPLRRLVGDGVASEGETHREARKALHPAFTGRHMNAMYDGLSGVVGERITDLVARTGGEPFDVYEEMTAVIHRALNGVFFGGRMDLDQSGEVGAAIQVATTSFTSRLAMPWVPQWAPMPGDRRFKRAVKVVDDAVLPLVEIARRDGEEAGIASMLAAQGYSDTQIRDELLAVAVAGSESTAVALCWLFVVLDANPDVADRLYAEIDEVVGDATPTRQHLHWLTYTRMLLDELLRMYPVGWIIPRKVARDDVVDGMRIKGGSTVVISPYLTHRVPDVWPEPDRFDPGRFAKDQVATRHPLAYLGFGAGAHSCLGQQFFYLEAQLIMAALLARHRPVLEKGPAPVKPKISLALIPDRQVRISLRPRG